MTEKTTDTGEAQGGHKGFSDGGERPWRGGRHPGDGPEYGAAYGVLTDTLSNFLDRLAEAGPDEYLVSLLTSDLETWARELESLAVAERDRVFGRLTNLHGRGQSMSPKIVITGATPDSVSGTVRFGSYFLGGNGAAHGGAIPLVFDEILGRLANSAERPPQRTAYLHTDFRSITPIGRTLRFHGWLASHEGRKRVLRATLHDGETLCAEAEGLFVALKPGQP